MITTLQNFLANWTSKILISIKPVVWLASLVLFLPSLVIFLSIVSDVINKTEFLILVAGALFFIPFWFKFVRQWNTFHTIEHEVTHGIFMILCFQTIKTLVTNIGGGHIAPKKPSMNWLIFLAPYFFPTFSILVVILIIGFDAYNNTWLLFLLGMTISYQLFSTYEETHMRQTDLHHFEIEQQRNQYRHLKGQKLNKNGKRVLEELEKVKRNGGLTQHVGFPFAFAFLPTVNLVIYASLIGISINGLDYTIYRINTIIDIVLSTFIQHLNLV
jgi:hypothetical protein